MHVLKSAFALIISLTCASAYAQVNQDGPYIHRDGQRIISKYILNNTVKTDTLKPSEPIMVRFAEKPQWDFSFKLQQNIGIPAAEYKAVNKLLVLSDIEGEFEAFRTLMIANKVMDEQYNWIFGKGHLVICGDLFDRGKEVMPYIWLLYKLEQDAIKKGGFVHVLLGNHDVMNMEGDLRYQAPKYQTSVKLMGLDYGTLIAADTELGKWLRSKNAVEKIGDRIFLHGGISPEINAQQLSLNELNQKCRLYYGVPTKALNKEGTLLFKSSGPFWYRGYFGKEQVSVNTVDSTLSKFKVKQIVVGHTITEQNISGYYGGKVIGIDVNQHKANHKAVLFIGKQAFVVDDKGKQEALGLSTE
ncbi:metallophosphoesterase [Pedobacter aquatilis]|uniref:metallophosphoesterase n=1 Tax=Pedobacter aquatilis TaxID=351343 RepID=UPI00292E72B0|nr:metallophosphoesterase [Pedobacter aquatilis]